MNLVTIIGCRGTLLRRLDIKAVRHHSLAKNRFMNTKRVIFSKEDRNFQGPKKFVSLRTIGQSTVPLNLSPV